MPHHPHQTRMLQGEYLPGGPLVGDLFKLSVSPGVSGTWHECLTSGVWTEVRPISAWPIGSVFWTSTNANAATVVGFGTWVSQPLPPAMQIWAWKRTA
jgi:hypothetical protein